MEFTATVYDLLRTNLDFQKKWMKIYEDKNMHQLRVTCHDLFEEEPYWQNLVFEELGSYPPEQLQGITSRLFKRIKEHIDQKLCELTDDGQKINLKCLMERLDADYQQDCYTLFLTYGDCAKRERQLVDKYSQEQYMQVDSQISLRDLTDEISNLKDTLDQNIQTLPAICDQEDKLREALLMFQGGTWPQLNGSQNNQQYQSFLRELKNCQDKKRHIVEILNSLHDKSTHALAYLKEEMKKYKLLLQKEYVDLAELESKPHLSLDLEEGYASLGKTLYELLLRSIPKARQFGVVYDPTSMKSTFMEALRSSFVTIDQKRLSIKVELGTKKQKKKELWEGGEDEEESASQKFKCPKFSATVRLLAADKIEGKVKVKAQFCQEDEVNSKYQSGHWDTKCRFRLKSQTDEATFDRKKALATFKKLELENFERKQQDRHVCEDKFRIVFTTSIPMADEKIDVQTISLPIVVTTGASQVCNVYGSLLWQCCNMEDAFALPIRPIEELPWSSVFNMLDLKFLTLNGRHLSKEEKLHLGNRLMQCQGLDEEVKDDDMVPFRKFCIDKMMDIREGEDKKKSATFWMWFHAVFNLVKNHLLDYWRKGLIAGFLSKETTQKLLLTTAKIPQAGSYLLRFSDKVITDGQGQNVCGAITASFVKDEKGILKVDHAHPFDSKKLKEKCLSSIIRRMTSSKDKEKPVLKFLHPDSTLTEEAFKDFTEENRNKGDVPGYKKFEELLILEMENMSLEDKDGTRPKKRASRTNKRGGKIPKQEAPLDCQVPAGSSIPATVLEQDGASQDCFDGLSYPGDQTGMTGNDDSNSSTATLVCQSTFPQTSYPQVMPQQQQLQMYGVQDFNVDQISSVFTTAADSMITTSSQSMVFPENSFLAALEQDGDMVLPNIQNLDSQENFQEQNTPSSILQQNPAPATQGRTPSVENPTLASLLQRPQPNQGSSVPSAAGNIRSAPPFIGCQNSQADTAMNPGSHPAGISRSLSLGERKIQPTKPLASKIESFEKLSNKLQPAPQPCADNFPGAPSPADSGISVNSPVNPSMVMGETNGFQPHNTNHGDNLQDQGNIPNFLEQPEQNLSPVTSVEGNTGVSLEAIIEQLFAPQNANNPTVQQLQTLILNQLPGLQVTSSTATLPSEATPSSTSQGAVYSVPDSTMSPEGGSNHQHMGDFNQ